MPKKSKKNSGLKQGYSLKSVWGKHKILIIIAVVLFGGAGAYFISSSKAGSFVYASQFGYGCRTTPTIGVGNQGPCVKVVQDALNRWSCNQKFSTKNSKNPYNYTPLAVDGVYGQKTKSRVIEFQKAKNVQGKNIAADGIVGSATWLTLQADNTAWQSCDINTGPGK